MNNTKKLGIGYITCSAPERVLATYPTIPKGIGEIVVVNSGGVLSDRYFPDADKIIQTGRMISVAVAKNRAMRYLINNGCEHIFLVEDDMIIKNSGVFREYLKAAEASGIWHLNYALQGALNRVQSGDASINSIKDINALNIASKPAPRAKLGYDNGSKLAFYQHALSSFQYFYRGVIKNVGYFDERYTNAFENIDYMYRVVKKGLHPPFWWFADIDNADEYLDSLSNCMSYSVLRNDVKFADNMLFGKQWFKGKFDISPELISDVTEREALRIINDLKFKYARKLR